MTDTKTLQDARNALQFNEDNGLYAGDAKHYRVYATFDGGKYNNQVAGIKSLIMLERYLQNGQKFKDISIITDAQGFDELTPKRG